MGLSQTLTKAVMKIMGKTEYEIVCLATLHGGKRRLKKRSGRKMAKMSRKWKWVLFSHFFLVPRIS